MATGGTSDDPGWHPATRPASVALALIGVVGLSVSLSPLYDAGFAASAVAGVGFLLTAGALSAAILIFDRQGQQARQSQMDVSKRFDTVDERLGGLIPDEAHKVATDAEVTRKEEASSSGDQGTVTAQEATQGDSVRELSPDLLAAVGVSAEDIGDVAAYAGEDIPLRPLEALYSHLKRVSHDVEGGVDYLSPRNLLGYRVRGRGPRFWYISTPDAPGPGRRPENRRTRTLWRISFITGEVTAV